MNEVRSRSPMILLVRSPTSFKRDPKRAAMDQWNADPCGPDTTQEAGTAGYIQELIRGRQAYAPWMAEFLDYPASVGLRVLDLGCGQGIDLVQYAEAGADVAGVDLTPRHVELAQAHLAARGLSGRALLGDAERLPFSDDHFDRVSSNGVLHHTPDMPAALREIRRVLRPGGETRVIVYNRNSLHFWVDQVLGYGILRGYLVKERSIEGVMSRTVERSTVDARPLVRVYSSAQVRVVLRKAGFEDVRTEVRHFHANDTFVTARLQRRLTALRDPERLERIGRRSGWYVIAAATKPA